MAPSEVPALHVLVRVWLPDRPGALGLVASRIGAMRGDIVGIDVLERGVDVAVDEFAVVVPDRDSLPLLLREIEEVDGASVEEIREVGAFPDPRLDALESAALLCESADGPALCSALVAHTQREFLGDWTALVADEAVIASAGELPGPEPSVAALAAGTAASPSVAAGEAGPDDVAIAPLPAREAVLIVGRVGHPFRRRERAQLLAVARIAGRTWSLLTGR